MYVQNIFIIWENIGRLQAFVEEHIYFLVATEMKKNSKCIISSISPFLLDSSPCSFISTPYFAIFMTTVRFYVSIVYDIRNLLLH